MSISFRPTFDSTPSFSSSSSSSPMQFTVSTVPVGVATTTKDRVIVTTKRGGSAAATAPKKQVRITLNHALTVTPATNGSISRTIVNGNPSLTNTSTSSSSAVAAGGRVKIATKRKSGDVTTFTRTISNGDAMEDERKDAGEEEEEAHLAFQSALQSDDSTVVLETASKRGRTQNGAAVTFSLSSASTSSPTTTSLPTPMPLQPKFSPALVEKVTAARTARVANAAAASQSKSARPTTGMTFPASAGVHVAPVPAAGPTTTILLRNLSPAVTAQFLLTNLFGVFDVRSLTIETAPSPTGQNLCTGVAHAVLNEKDAQEAMDICQNQLLLGKPVRMSLIKETEGSEEQLQERQRAQAAVQQQRAAVQQPQQTKSVVPLSSTPFFAPPSHGIAPTQQQSASGSSSSSSAPFSSPFSAASNLNVGFVWGQADSSMDNGETVFNITNLKLPAMSSSSTFASSSSSIFSGVQQKKQIQVRPKGVVMSDADAMSSNVKKHTIVTKTGTVSTIEQRS